MLQIHSLLLRNLLPAQSAARLGLFTRSVMSRDAMPLQTVDGLRLMGIGTRAGITADGDAMPETRDTRTNEQRYYDTLTRIAKHYQTAQQLLCSGERQYGIDGTEALEYAYENIQGEARAAIKGKRRPVDKPAVSKRVQRDAAAGMKADMASALLKLMSQRSRQRRSASPCPAYGENGNG